jgi:hypothetical protein
MLGFIKAKFYIVLYSFILLGGFLPFSYLWYFLTYLVHLIKNERLKRIATKNKI